MPFLICGSSQAGRAFSESCDKLYIADIGIPKGLYAEHCVGYHHPFFDKSVVKVDLVQ